MNLRHWQHALTIAELGSFSVAAERTGLAQPVLSRETRELEQALGVQLFHRHARGVVPTEAGEQFFARARKILAEIGNIGQDIRSGIDEPSGLLAMGLPPSLATFVTGPLIEGLRRDYPALRLHVREATSIHIRDGLLAGEIDVGLLSTPLSEPRLELEPLAREPMMLIGPIGDPIGLNKPLPIEALVGLPLVLARRPNSTRIIVEHALEAIGHSAIVPIETDTAPIADFVLRGLGYTIMPSSFVSSRAAEGLFAVPVDGLSISWMIGWRSVNGNKPAVLQFRERVQELARIAIAAKSWRAELLA